MKSENFVFKPILVSLAFFTFFSAASGQEVPYHFPSPTMPTPAAPAPGHATIGGVVCTLVPSDSGDWGNLNFPNPPAYEEIYDGSTLKIGTFRWGATYDLGPAGVLEVTATVTHHTYSLDTGTHRLLAYGIGADPLYYEDNPEDPWPNAWFFIRLQEVKVWSGDWRIKVVVSDPLEGNSTYYISINDPGIHELYTWGKRQSWDIDAN